MTTSPETRFEFGKNWSDFSDNINTTEIAQAVVGLKKLLPPAFLPQGKSFLDIGSGSGIHSVAASNIGFSPITCTDYDLNSVETTRQNIDKFAPQISSTIFQDDILHSELRDKFDVVYSWGVLHHTGKMWQAIESASQKVKDEGVFIIAIYTKTKFCSTWKTIKKIYCKSPSFIQRIMGYTYHFIRSFRQILNGEVFKNYKNERGMNRYHDSIDWLGGFPYESASKDEIIAFLEKDFDLVSAFRTEPGLGLLGTGCAEYTFIKKKV